MKKLLVLVAVVAIVYFAVPHTAPTFLLGGIQVNEPDHGAWIEAVDRAGMNTVAVTVYAKQGDWNSDNLWYEEEEPWVVEEVRKARAGGLESVLVLRVALDHAFPVNKYFWHGMIAPETDEQLEEWFRRYTEFAVKWAKVAEEEGIGVLAVSSELNSMTNTNRLVELPGLEEYFSNPEKVEFEKEKILDHRTEIEDRHLWVRGYDPQGALDTFLDERSAKEAGWATQVAFLESADPLAEVNARRAKLEAGWREVIRQVRRHYSGQLTYAANFDQYEFVKFWDALDLISVNAYFPLRRHLVPDIGEDELGALLTSRWEVLLRRLLAFREEQGLGERRVLLTELGYVRRKNSTIEPWADHGFSVLPSPEGQKLVVWQDQPFDLTERALAVRGLYRANLAVGGDLLAGILYWKLSTIPSHVDVEAFVLILDSGDPLQSELEAYRSQLPWDRLRQRIPLLSKSD